MPLKPTELGERLHVDLRAGVAGVGSWRGVRREGDPASIADDQLWYAQNVRLTGGKIITRGGQEAVNTVAAEGCIDGFFDAGDMGAAQNEALSDGVVASCGTGYGEYVSSRLFVPGNVASYYDATNGLKKTSQTGTAAFVYDDGTRVLVGTGTSIYALRNNSAAATLVCTTTLSVTSLAKFGSTYYIGCANGSSSSHVALWDGTSATPSSTELPGTDDRAPMVVADAADVYAIYQHRGATDNTTTTTFYRRNSGAWNNVSVSLNDFDVKCAVVHGGTLYFGGNTESLSSTTIRFRIYSYSAAATTLERTGPSTGTSIQDLFSADGDLFYVWTDVTPSAVISLGTNDGAWNDSFKTPLAGTTRFYGDFGGELYLYENTNLVRTSSRDLSAAYTTVVSSPSCIGIATWNQNGAVL